jgi:hypothetical protein
MNVNYSTSIKGEYSLYDENMDLLCETDNLITDWGMRRFVGDVSMGAPNLQVDDIAARVFCSNIIEIVLGTDDTPATVSDFHLASMIPITSYAATNENSTTGTSLSVDSFDNLVITFTKMTRFQFDTAFVGPSAIKEIGCSWTNTAFQANNRYGIFSRATLPLAKQFSVLAGNVIFAKYTLTITTNCNQVLSGMDRFNGTGAVNLPENKTNVRRLPFYTLPSDADFVTLNAPGQTYSYNNTNTWNPNILNNTLNRSFQGITSVSPRDPVARPNDFREFVQPLFEDPGLLNFKYSGSGRTIFNSSLANSGNTGTAPFQDNVYGTQVDNDSAYKIWWLQMYTTDWVGVGDNPNSRFDTFTSSTTAFLNNTTSGIEQSNAVARSLVYSTAVQQNLDLLAATPSRTGRKHAEKLQGETIQVNQNTWTRTIKFLFTPDQLKPNTTWFKLYPATLGDWDNSGRDSYSSSYTYEDRTGTSDYGIITVLKEPYTPTSNFFDGIQYTFTFTRS